MHSAALQQHRQISKSCSTALESVRGSRQTQLFLQWADGNLWPSGHNFICPSFRFISSPCVHFHHITAHNCFSASSYLPSCYTASGEAGLSLSWLWWLSPSTFSSDYGQHTRCVSFNYLNCLTADCTHCTVPSPTKVKLPDWELTRLFSSHAGTQSASDLALSRTCSTEPRLKIIPFLKWVKGERTARPAEVHWRSEWSAINPDVELITILLHSVCSW